MSGSLSAQARHTAGADEFGAPERATLGIAGLDDDRLRARLEAGRHRGDPAADALVEVFRELPGGSGWQLFERALEQGVDAVPGAPEELGALLTEASSTPSWLDLDLVDAGAASFWRAGLPALAPSLIYGSLAFGYQYGDLSRPLAATGRLERMASRRLGETARWVLAVTTPGAMAPGGEGWRSSLRVRIVHALVRRHLLDGGSWDAEAWGVPISASAMMATAIGGFNIVPQRALSDVGAGATAADRESRTALWRWVGYVMGVPPALLPCNWREAERLIDTLATFDFGPNEDGPALMHALTHHGLPLEGLLPPWGVRPARLVLTPMIEALVRRWLGEAVSDELGVGRTPVVRLVPLARPLVRSLGLVLASGLLGDERRTAQTQIRLVGRLLDRAGDPDRPLAPGRAVPGDGPRRVAA
ncbi:MAG TPA: oxygenase MpaB family protein [Solirubrobacteraceae bacterium]|nr:oxygenase MpaB family protein [Solirubrobacteraceae bacterium]